MSVKSTLQEIIAINKVIVENKLDKLKPRSEEMTSGYNSLVKPLLDKFKESHSFSTNGFIKNLLDKSDSKSISNLKLKAFGNWGRKINPYVWTSFFINTAKKNDGSTVSVFFVTNYKHDNIIYHD